MTNIVKKCPKDGIVYDAAFSGTCESCFGPLQFYCKTHNQWLVDATCNLCPKPAGAPPADPTPTGPKGYWFGLVLVALLAVLIGSGLIIWRVLAPRKWETASKPQSPPPIAVTPVKQPPPVIATQTGQIPIDLPLNRILDDPDLHLGKLVKTTGVLQFQDTDKETFDLRQGDFSVQVQYAGIAPTAKSILSAANPGRELTVTGVLRRDENLNAIYIVAQEIATR